MSETGTSQPDEAVDPASAPVDHHFMMPGEDAVQTALSDTNTYGDSTAKNLALSWLSTMITQEKEAMIFPTWITDVLTREEITAFEVKGIIFSGMSKSSPEGGIYVKGRFHSSLEWILQEHTPATVQAEVIDAIYATAALRGVAGLVTHPGLARIPDEIPGLPKLPVDSLVMAAYQDGQWSKSHAFPDGKLVIPGMDNAAIQYGQSCFEGMIAQGAADMEVGIVDGEVTIFRPEENARRFQKSCEAAKIPPVPVDQFLQAVMVAVKRNKRFMPESGSLYVRPYAFGIQKGLGVKPAEKYIFAVEVTSFQKYVASAKSESADAAIEEMGSTTIKAITMNRGVHGNSKIAANYSVTFQEKMRARAEGFGDVLLVDDFDNLQELSSSNIFLVNCLGVSEGGQRPSIKISTPPIRSNILPGITRKSILELLRDPAIQQRLAPDAELIVEDDDKITIDDIDEFQGAFGCGTAWGMAKINGIQDLDGVQIEFNRPDDRAKKLIEDLYQILLEARSGKLAGYEHWAVKVKI